ncbi:hypothetical protein [Pseudomonas nicosulfuronedens]
MDEKNAFGTGLRHLRFIRGLSQDAFTPVLSLAHASVIELGKKLIALDRVGGLAAALDVHPLTLLTAMYVEYDGLSVGELLSRVQKDFENLAAQPPSQSVGKDSRDRSSSSVEAARWLKEKAKVEKRRTVAKAPAKKRAVRPSIKKPGGSGAESAKPALPGSDVSGTV